VGPASIDLDSCKVEDGANIVNSGGSLACEEPLPPLPANAADIPAGSYSGSCHGCAVSEGVLTCSACLDAAKARHLASIDVSACKSFDNSNGVLKCEKDQAMANPGLPAGAYQGSCTGCSTSGRTLFCLECQDGQGSTLSSELFTAGCTSVGNNAGRLVCDDPQSGGSKPPAGAGEEL